MTWAGGRGGAAGGGSCVLGRRRVEASMKSSMAAAVTNRLPPMQRLSSLTPLQPFKHQRQIVETCGFWPVILPR
jgi:hypothetical protein